MSCVWGPISVCFRLRSQNPLAYSDLFFSWCLNKLSKWPKKGSLWIILSTFESPFTALVHARTLSWGCEGVPKVAGHQDANFISTDQPLKTSRTWRFLLIFDLRYIWPYLRWHQNCSGLLEATFKVEKFPSNLNKDLVFVAPHPPTDGQRPYFRAF